MRASPFGDFAARSAARGTKVPTTNRICDLLSLLQIQRALNARRLGDAFVRRPKRGFAPPLGKWLREDLRELAGDLLLGAGRLTADYLDSGAIERIWREHASGARNHARRLWALLMLELWFRTHQAGRSRKASDG